MSPSGDEEHCVTPAREAAKEIMILRDWLHDSLLAHRRTYGFVMGSVLVPSKRPLCVVGGQKAKKHGTKFFCCSLPKMPRSRQRSKSPIQSSITGVVLIKFNFDPAFRIAHSSSVARASKLELGGSWVRFSRGPQNLNIWAFWLAHPKLTKS